MHAGKLLCAVLLMSVCVSAQTASGTLTINGEETPLRHAYAIDRADPFESGQREIVVVLSDTPIEDLDLYDLFGLRTLAREGKLQAIEVRFTPEGEVKSAGLYHPAVGDATVTRTGMDHFEKQEFSQDKIAGKLWMENPSTLADLEHIYSAIFSALVERGPKPSAEGEAALTSGLGAAAAAFLRAAAAKDFDAVLKTVTAGWAEVLKQFKKEFLAEAAEAFPARVKITRVYERGARAVVDAEAPGDKEPTKIKVYREGGEWRVSNQ